MFPLRLAMTERLFYFFNAFMKIQFATGLSILGSAG
jgi:hypothetical protein